MNSVEIKDKIKELKSSIYEIIDNCKVEIRDFNDDEKNRINIITDEIRNLNSELNKLNEDFEVIENKNNIKKEDIKMKEFRLLSAINDIANGRKMNEESEAVVNAGVEEMRSAGLSYSGQIQIPVSEMRANIVTDHFTGDGSENVGVDVADMLVPLRAKNVLVKAGAKFLTGLVGDVMVPVLGASSVSWEGETGSHDGGSAVTSVKLQPKRLTAYVDVSKQFLNQTSAAAEAMIKNDLINAINSKLEATVLGSAAGTSNMPQGIFYTTASGGLTTYGTFAKVAELESLVDDANVMGECSYIMSNKAKAAYRTIAKGSTNGGFILENGAIDGTPVYNTSNVENKNVAFGDFSQLAIGQWGAIDLTIDPYTVAKDGKVRLVVNAYFDAVLLRSGAIAVGKQA